jgi:hypothetical protein
MHKEAQMGDMMQQMGGGDPNDPANDGGDPAFQHDPNVVPPGTPTGVDSNMSPSMDDLPQAGG